MVNGHAVFSVVGEVVEEVLGVSAEALGGGEGAETNG